MNLFKNRTLLLVTKHGKEEVLKPLLEKNLRVNCKVTDNFDTDIFGTFSGEITRKEDALATVRKKCLAAMNFYNCDLAVASEGSFGPHPAAFFTTVDDELVMLIDLKNNLEIIGRKLSMKTNFASREFTDSNLFQPFLKQIKFPSHKVILKSSFEDGSEIYKDKITEEEVLQDFNFLIAEYGVVSAETDMRAMNNPTRMKVIKEAGENLIEKINARCPECNCPGFAVTSSVEGLPCSCCRLPTKSTLFTLLTCAKCNFSEKNYFPRNLKFEDPMFCDNCNP